MQSCYVVCYLFIFFNIAELCTGGRYSSNAQYKLLQIHILARHGARTPIHLIPGVEEVTYNKSELLAVLDHTNVRYTLKEENGKRLEHPGEMDRAYLKKIFKGGSEAGQLTVVGQQQAYEFGLMLRNRFVEKLGFLNRKFSREDVYLRSTNIKRTIETIRCVMAGLYGKAELNEPFIIHTVNDKDEIFYPNPHCEILRFLAHRNWMHFESDAGEMSKDFKMLEELLGVHGTGKVDYVHIRDDITCRMVHGLSTPDILMAHYDLIDRHAVRMFLYQCTGYSGDDTDLMLKLSVGPIFRRFRDRMDERIRGLKSPKLFIYGVHDSSIVPVLVALGVFNNHWLPFMANVSFELYQGPANNSSSGRYSHFVRVSYCGKYVTIPGCTSDMCLYDVFWKSLSEYEVPTARLPSECSDQAKHRVLMDAYVKQLNADEESDSDMPVGM